MSALLLIPVLLFAGEFRVGQPAARPQQPAAQPATQPETRFDGERLPDADQLIAILREREEDNQALLRHYAFTQYQESESYDAEGRVKDRRVTKIRVIPQKDGPPDAKLLEVDGRAPTAKEVEQFDSGQRKMREREQKALAKQQKKQKTARGGGEEEERNSFTLLDLLKGPSYEVAGWDQVDGRRVVRVEIYPDTKKKVDGAVMKVARTARGTVWVDPGAGHVLRAEAFTTQPTKVGAGLAAVKEARFLFVNQLVRGELWFPREMVFEGSFRVLLKKERMMERVLFSDFVKAVTEVETQYEWPDGEGGEQPQSGAAGAPADSP